MNQRFELHLDGLLNGEALAEFERALASDAALRSEVDRQQAVQHSIDDSLRRQFAAPEAPGSVLGASLNGHAPRAIALGPRFPIEDSKSRPVGRIGWGRRFAAAAALLCLASGMWMIWMTLPRHGPLSDRETAAACYAREVRDFEPYWVCESNDQFAQAFRGRFGHALLLRPLPEGVSARGLDYAKVISQQTMCVLMLDGQGKVIVLVDRADREPAGGLDPALPEGVHMHRGRVGGLVLYELSQSPDPRMLHLFFDPDRESATQPQGQWK